MAKKGKGGRKEKGRRAGASAPPTPASRLVMPKALETRLNLAGVKTKK